MGYQDPLGVPLNSKVLEAQLWGLKSGWAAGWGKERSLRGWGGGPGWRGLGVSLPLHCHGLELE